MANSPTFSVSVGHLQSPTSRDWNNLVAGLVRPGLYHGGNVVPAGGLKVKVEPFIARNLTQTLRMDGEDWLEVTVPTTGRLLLVVHVFRSNLKTDQVAVEFITTGNLRDSHVVLAQLDIPLGAAEITSSMINTSVAERRSLDGDDFFGRLKTGTGRFKTENVIQHNLGHTHYAVDITPIGDAGSVGQLDIRKEADKVTVLNSGTGSGEFDWFVVVKDQAQTPTGVVYGRATLTPDVEVTLEHRLGSLNYFPFILPLTTPTGMYWVDKSDNSLTLGTSGDAFDAAWLAIPSQSGYAHGQASMTGSEVTVTRAIGHTEYRVFVTALTPSSSDKPITVTKRDDGFTLHGNGYTGLLQYLVVQDNRGLTGHLLYGRRANHFLNREDYLALVQPHLPVFTSVAMQRHYLYARNDTEIDYLVMPAEGTWTLGDWTRPSSSPVSPHIEIKSAAMHHHGDNGIVYREVIGQDNFITRVVARLQPATTLGHTTTLELYLNGELVSDIAIPGNMTYAAKRLVPIKVQIGDVAEVRLVGQAPLSAMTFNWFGMGDIELDGRPLNMEPPAPLRIVRVPIYASINGQRTFQVPTYIPGANNLTVRVNDRELLLRHNDYEEIDENTIRTKDSYNANDLIEVTVIGTLFPVEVPIGPNPGITPEQEATLESVRINVEQLIADFTELMNTNFSVTAEMIEALESLKINIEGTITGNLTGNVTGDVDGNVTGSASTLKNLQYTVDQLNNILAALTGEENYTGHWHASDRDRQNHTGKQTLETISDAGTAASKNVGMQKGQLALIGEGNRFDLTLLMNAVGNGFQVANEQEMLATNSKRGDLALRSDTKATYILLGEDSMDPASWIKLPQELTLGPDGKLALQLLTHALPDVFEIDELSEIVELEAKRGDIAIVGESLTYILAGDDPSQGDAWKQIRISLDGAAVTSFNGRSGQVTFSLDQDIDQEALHALISSNVSVQANTAKQTNATHSGEVTGSQELTIANRVITPGKIKAVGSADVGMALVIVETDGGLEFGWSQVVTSLFGESGDIDAVPADKVRGLVEAIDQAISDNAAVRANSEKETNAEHTGEVTGSTELTISEEVIQPRHLKVSGYGQGRILVADPSSANGWRWEDQEGGGSSSIDPGVVSFVEQMSDGSIRSIPGSTVERIKFALTEAGADYHKAQPLVSVEAFWTVGSIAHPGTTLSYSDAAHQFSLNGTASILAHAGFDRGYRFVHSLAVEGPAGTDNGVGMLLLAFTNEDNTLSTLSAVRSPGGTGFTWALIRDWGLATQEILVNASDEIAWGNGNLGADATDAVYTTSDWATLGACHIYARMLGSELTITTTNFGSGVEAGEIVYDLTDMQSVNMKARVGFIADTAGSTFTLVPGSSLRANLFVDLHSMHVYQRDAQQDWTADTRLVPNDVMYVGRVIVDPVTGGAIKLNLQLNDLGAALDPTTELVIINQGAYVLEQVVASDQEISVPIAAYLLGAEMRPRVQTWAHLSEEQGWIPADVVFSQRLKDGNFLLKNVSGTEAIARILIGA